MGKTSNPPCKRTEDGLVRRLKEGMTLDEIAKEMCNNRKHPKRKVIGWIKSMPGYGEEWLLNDENAKTHDYDNKALKREFNKQNKRKQDREELQKNAMATDDEIKELKELLTEFKNNVNSDTWSISINKSIVNVDIPQTALRLHKKYPKHVTFTRMLENPDMAQMIVDFAHDYPYTYQDTFKSVIKDIKSELAESDNESTTEDDN